MDCTAAQIALSAWLDGELSPQEAQELQEHLAGCPRCRALREEFTALSDLLREAPAPAVPPALKEQVMANLPPQEGPKGKLISVQWKRWGAMAAVAAIVIAAAVWFRFPTATKKDASADLAAVTSNDLANAPADDPESPLDAESYKSVAPVSESIPTNGAVAVEEYGTDIEKVPITGAISDSDVRYAGYPAGSEGGLAVTGAISAAGSVPESAAVTSESASASYDAQAASSPTPEMAMAQMALYAKSDVLLESEVATEDALLNLASSSDAENGSVAASVSTDAQETPEPLQKSAFLSQEKPYFDDLEQVVETSDVFSSYCAVLTIPSARDGLLQGYYYMTREDGSTLYLLPAAQFDALVSELSQGGVDYTLRTAGDGISPSAPYGLVVITALN